MFINKCESVCTVVQLRLCVIAHYIVYHRRCNKTNNLFSLLTFHVLVWFYKIPRYHKPNTSLLSGCCRLNEDMETTKLSNYVHTTLGNVLSSGYFQWKGYTNTLFACSCVLKNVFGLLIMEKNVKVCARTEFYNTSSFMYWNKAWKDKSEERFGRFASLQHFSPSLPQQ